MSLSRGLTDDNPSISLTSESSTEAKANVRSSSALTSAKQNLSYLLDPSSPNSPRPVHLRTRALLRSLHFLGVFIFWRIVRYAKYALVGSIIAAVGASVFGGVLSGAAFVIAPPTIATSVGIGAIWALGKWGFRKMGVGEKVVIDAEINKQQNKEETKKDGTWSDVHGPRAVPW